MSDDTLSSPQTKIRRTSIKSLGTGKILRIADFQSRGTVDEGACSYVDSGADVCIIKASKVKNLKSIDKLEILIANGVAKGELDRWEQFV